VFADRHYPDTHFLVNPEKSDFDFIFEHRSFDLCINCSGAASVPDSLTDPMKDYNLNTINVFKILDSLRRIRPECKFINLSSAAVYGNPGKLPIREDFAQRPLSPYGFHKVLAEQICNEFRALYGIRTCSLRIFSAYGPGLRKQIFWDLYKKIKSGQPFTLYGTGNESRDFIYILDIVKAIELVYKHAPFDAEVINVANGEEIRIRDAVTSFAGLFNSEISFSFSGDSRKGDPLNWKADIKILTSFGYKKSVDLESGLKKYLDWVLKNDKV
jgi:UDP-glucose 4-epimerase